MAEIEVQKFLLPVINTQYRRPNSSIADGQPAYNTVDHRLFLGLERWIQFCNSDDPQNGKAVFYPEATGEPTTNWLTTTPDFTTATRDPADITAIKLHWGDLIKFATGAPSWSEIFGVGDYIVLSVAGFTHNPYIFLIATSSVATVSDHVEQTLGVSIVQPDHANITENMDGNWPWVVDFIRG